MTLELIETRKVTCNSCGMTEEKSWNKGRVNPIMEDERFFRELKEKGWVYDGDNTHYCPDCAEGGD